MSFFTSNNEVISMNHLPLRLTTRSEERNTSTSCFTSNNEVRSKESSCFTSNSEVRSNESYILPLSGRVLSDYTKLISKVFKLYMR